MVQLNGVSTKDAYIRILTRDDKEIPHSSVIVDSRGIDLAAVIIDDVPDELEIRSVYFATDYKEIIDEVIILGFPPISTSLKPHLLVHKGEINAYVKTKDSIEDMIVFSARTFPGNSGGPIMNNMGRVVGIVTQSVEFKISEDNKEIRLSDYYMGIPASDIVEFINEQVLPAIIQ